MWQQFSFQRIPSRNPIRKFPKENFNFIAAFGKVISLTTVASFKVENSFVPALSTWKKEAYRRVFKFNSNRTTISIRVPSPALSLHRIPLFWILRIPEANSSSASSSSQEGGCELCHKLVPTSLFAFGIFLEELSLAFFSRVFCVVFAWRNSSLRWHSEIRFLFFCDKIL